MSWTLRLLLEKSEHTLSDFVTLTYDQEHCPDRLSQQDFKLFIKRLRNATQSSVRYFCCGEYGGSTKRPHWHVLVFGVRFRQRGRFLTKLWPFGHVYCGEIAAGSAQYVCRYTLKSMAMERDHEVYMSRRPGIGMDVLRRISAGLVDRVPDMEYYPPVMSYSSRSYWLDRHAYDACVDSYLNAGGVLTYDRAPVNDWLDSSVKALPVEHLAKEWLRKTRKGIWVAPDGTSQKTDRSISSSSFDLEPPPVCPS